MKKMSYLAILVVMLAVIFTINCEKATHGSNKPKPQKPVIVYIGIDGSGSYNYIENAKQRLQRVIEYLPTGARVTARWITSDSYLPNNSICSMRLPTLNIDNKNPFDTKNKVKRLQFKDKEDKAKRELELSIVKAPFPNSKYTDILGFLLLCSERSANFRMECEKYIIMFTDLKNNVMKYGKYLDASSLKDFQLLILSYEHTDPGLKKKWQENFREWGALPGRYYGPDEDFPNFFKEEEL